MKYIIPFLFFAFAAGKLAAQTCTIYFTTVDSLPTGSIWVTAHMSGSNPTYLWANGATSPTIEITAPGAYLVNAANAEGCTIGTGYVAECETRIRAEGNTLKAYKILGGNGLSYSWDTGETTQAITPGQSGNYCVTVTGSNNCSGGLYSNSNCFYYQTFCTAFISNTNNTTLTANGAGIAPFTYHWTPGNYNTQTIAPGMPGTYCVTITDGTGCQAYACESIWDPLECGVDIFFSPSFDSISSGWLFAETVWQDPGNWEFEWDNGSTNQSIQLTSGGEHCVTVTNWLTGCMDTACYWYWPDSTCYAEIHVDSIGLYNAFLSVTGGPFDIVDYEWNTGSVSAINETQQFGIQTATITNTEGCTASASYYLHPNFPLEVTIQFPDSSNFGNNGVQALIYLIEYDTAQGGILTAIDTIEPYIATNGWARGRFDDIQPGQYLIKVALLPNSNGYDDYLPTYFLESIFWNGATPYTYTALTTSTWPNIDILMVPGQNPGGPGFIGGLVSEGANVHSGNGEESTGEGDPLAGITVILTLADGTPVAATVTDVTGQYAFSNIAWGTYIITLDIPGLPLVSTTVTIGPNNPSASNINFKVDENSIALPATETALQKVIEVSPNPAHDVVFIETPENADLTLTDVRGETVLQVAGTNSKTKLSLAYLASGMYFLTVRTAGSIEIVKVIKQ